MLMSLCVDTGNLMITVSCNLYVEMYILKLYDCLNIVCAVILHSSCLFFVEDNFRGWLCICEQVKHKNVRHIILGPLD